MKRIKISLLVMAIAVIIYGCGDSTSSSSSPESDLNTDSSSQSSELSTSSSSEESSQEPENLIDFSDYIKTASAINTEIALFEVDESIAATNLALTSLNTTQIVQLLDATGFVADRVVVVVTPSPEDAEKVSDALTAHTEKLIEDFSDYNPQEVPKLESAIYHTDGNITALFIGEYAEQYFNELVLFMEGASL